MKAINLHTRRGPMAYLSNDVYIGRAIEFYNEVNEIEIEFLLSLLKSDDVVVDIGANIGTHTIPFAQKVKKVYAFEPQLPIFDLLVENIKLNLLGEKIELFNCALGREDNTAFSLPKIDYDAPGNFGGIGCTESISDKPVEVRVLDRVPIERIALLKIDVEGSEIDVLNGAKGHIHRSRPLLYVENDRPEKSAALIDLIQGLGYRLYWHLPPLFNPANILGKSENIFPNEVGINMLCVPFGDDLPQIKSLRPVAGPHDTPTGIRAAKVRPPNGWAGVARFGGIGDNLMAASACYALKRKGFKVEMITGMDGPWQVFEHNPNIDKLSLKTKSEFPADMLPWQKWFKGRSDEYDAFAHLSHSCEAALAFFPASTAFWWPAHVRRRLCNYNYLEMVHDIAGCGYEFGPLFYSSPSEHDRSLETKERVGKKAIAWCLAGSRLDKMHPYTPGIIARLIKEIKIPVVLLGRPGKNFEDAEKIREHVKKTNGSTDGLHIAISANPDEVGNRDWPIRRTISFAQVCDLVIGPDTGVMWGVAFENVPKIMLLSHASPENITKHWLNTITLHADQKSVPCWPCHQLHDDPSTCTPNAENTGAACITSISVEKIVTETRRVLDQSQPPS